MTHVIPLGTSEPQDFGLLNNDAPLNGSGLSVALEIFRGTTPVTDSPPTVAWLNQAAGTVRVLGVETLTRGEYRVRYKLTDAGALVGYAPNQEDADLWIVVRIPNKASSR